MRKFFAFFFALTLIAHVNVRADEGMWLLSLLKESNWEKMKEMGLELTPEQIYSVNQSSLKDAVGALDRGSCTAELISAEGLLLTNHHCGYGEIQYHSTVEDDYLKNGFWAMTREEELPNEGKTISFLVRMEEVTERVLADVTDEMTVEERARVVRSAIREITAEPGAEEHYEKVVRPMFEGNRYFLFVMETYLDVRLVGAPPESIGKFGADTDNWMWPRHTGDFALFRVYTGPDGKPAEYSADNIPLKPKHHLPVSLAGYEKGDYAMVLGFPGGTDRYMTSWEVERLLEVEHPNRIKIRGLKQDLMMEDMQADPKVRLQYASKYSRSSNYWKYSIGQSQGLKNLNVVAKKRATEEKFTDWVNESEQRQEKYGEALDMIRAGVEATYDSDMAWQYMIECMLMGMESVSQGFGLMELHGMLSQEEVDNEAVQGRTEALKEAYEDFLKDYNMPTDKKVMTALMKLYIEDIDPQFRPSFTADIDDVDKWVEKYFKKSMIVDKEEYFEFLDDPSLKTLEKDMIFEIVSSTFAKVQEIRGMSAEADMKIDQGRRLFLDGLIRMNPEKDFYPDANSTMRLTYGSVGDYKARDAVYYAHYTTLKGVMEKEDPDNYEFVVSDKLKALYEEKDFGRYGNNGIMNVCFTTNNDITGGNSGSPVINGKGELIGVAFDGNWEAMSGDVAFETELQKCINVDIRYVLFVIDKFAGASHLVDEMTIVN